MPTSSENGSRSEDKTAQLMEYVETLVTMNEQQEEVNAELANRVDSRINEVSVHVDQQMDVILNSVQQKLNQFLENLATPLAHALEGKSGEGEANESQSQKPADEEDCDSDELHPEWEKQKKAMLADFGIDSQSAKQDSPGDDLAIVGEQPLSEIEPADEVLEALHDSIESIENIDSEEIGDLKTQLTSKLRDAEIELSINRAKLSQQWASLEQRQFEIEQRENNLKNKYSKLSNGGETDKKQGMLDRLSRHLSRGSHDIDDE